MLSLLLSSFDTVVRSQWVD